MKEPPLQAYLVCACWEDKRYPGIHMSKLYAALTADEESAVAVVRELRSPSDKVKATGQRFTAEKTRQLGLNPGDAIPL